MFLRSLADPPTIHLARHCQPPPSPVLDTPESNTDQDPAVAERLERHQELQRRLREHRREAGVYPDTELGLGSLGTQGRHGPTAAHLFNRSSSFSDCCDVNEMEVRSHKQSMISSSDVPMARDRLITLTSLQVSLTPFRLELIKQKHSIRFSGPGFTGPLDLQGLSGFSTSLLRSLSSGLLTQQPERSSLCCFRQGVR